MAPRDPVERMSQGKEFGEHGGVNGSVEVSTTFTVLTAETMPEIFLGEKGPEQGGCYLYGRSFNPTVRALSRQLALLEDTEAAYACASGMAAISCALLALCNHGDHIVASNTVYGGSFALLKTFLPAKCGVQVTFVDIRDVQGVEAAMRPNTKVVYTEAVSNPTLVVAPIQELAHVAHARGAQLVIDNTFTPCLITPRHHGADVIVHSMTKFMSGASDIIAGVVCGSRQLVGSLMDLHMGPIMLLGPTMDPRIASELALRVPHLALRMQEHSRRALYMAERLEAAGAQVTYPGLPSHPQHALLSRLLNPGYGWGGLLGIDLGSKAAADAFMERLQNKHGFGYMAVSLGYFDTLMSVSAASTSSEMKPEDLSKSGIQQGYVRMSIGLTGTLEQRWAQLQEAYTFVAVNLKGGAQAPYRAIKMQAKTDGLPSSLLSWPSLGSETCLDELEELAVQGVLAAAAAVAGAGEEVQVASVTAAASVSDDTTNGTGVLTMTELRGVSPTGEGDTTLVVSSAVTGAAASGTAGGALKRGSGSAGHVVEGPGANPEGVAARMGNGGGGAVGGLHAQLVKSGSIRKVRRLADGVEVVYVSASSSVQE